METLNKKISRKTVPENVRPIVETVFGCKWSLTILHVIQMGIHRPGAICRSIDGLSPKVMNFCLGKLTSFSILEKHSFAEVPPRVEYALTPFGLRFMAMFDYLEGLAQDLAQEQAEN